MKQLKIVGLLIGALTLVACNSTVGDNVINSEGQFTNNELDWPALEDASLPEGIFPNLENLSKIASGVTKKDLYYLIERPHFSETNGAEEWNYIMKFRQPNGSVRICQYKVLFDKNNVARNFYWLPDNCARKRPEKFVLNADALFPFNKGAMETIKPEGRQKLDTFAKYVVDEGNMMQLIVRGYTDYLGSDAYNLTLSQQRAVSVAKYLGNRGVNPRNIIAYGMGESSPVVTCNPSQARRALIDCLQPNRRVEIDIR